MKFKQNDINKIFYLCVFLWSFTYTTFLASELYTKFGVEIYKIYGYVWIVVKILLLIKLIIDIKQKNTIYDLCKIIVFSILFYISLINSQSTFLEPIFWFICTSKNCDMKKILKTIFWAQLLSMTLVLILSLIGFIPIESVLEREDGTKRYSIGFIHPNIFATMSLQLMMLYVVLKEKKLKYINCILGMAILVIINIVTDSKTITYLGIILWLSVIYYVFVNKNYRSGTKILYLIGKYSKYLVFLISLVCIYLAICEGDNGAFNSRLIQASTYFQYYGITLFGQPLVGYSNDLENLVKTGLYTLDMGYIYLLLGFGIVIFILFIYSYIIMCKYYAHEKKYLYVLVLGVYIIMGFSETYLIRTTYNFTHFFLIPIFWSDFKVKIVNKKVRLKVKR